MKGCLVSDSSWPKGCNGINEFSNDVPGVSQQAVLDLLFMTQHYDNIDEISAKLPGNTMFVDAHPRAAAHACRSINSGALRSPESQLLLRDERGGCLPQ